MINIDTRPDLISLLMELNRYNCQFIKENQVLIEIPQFIHKNIDTWYGLILVCKPNRTTIEVYICKDKENINSDAFIGCFEDITTLGDLIDRVLQSIQICDNCNEINDFNHLYIYNNKIICENCYKKKRSKY